MAAALPVVSTGVSGIPEVLRDDVTGIIVPEADPTATADAIERIVDDRALAARLGASARELVRDEFDLERNIGRLAEHLRTVPASAQSAP